VSRGSKRKGGPSAEERAAAREERTTAREQRADERAARVEASAKKRQRKALGRTVAKVAGVAAVVAIVAALFLAPGTRYAPGSEGAFIEGVQLYSNGAGHVDGSVVYPQNPPTGGEHNPFWLNCGIYDQPVRNENAVHSLEHGAVWVTYDPGLGEQEIEALRAQLPGTYVVVSPYPGLPSPIVLSAWNAQLQVSMAGDPRVPQFIEEYWRSQYVPEPGALCTGGVSGPGRS
jgi:hypothetical protein